VNLADRNPSRFKPGDRVRVAGNGHRNFGKVGVILSLQGVEDDHHGKPRAVISSGGGFSFPFVDSASELLHVSLPNLEKL
jgi:protein involved in polysaccharide export with SLBB domain